MRFLILALLCAGSTLAQGIGGKGGMGGAGGFGGGPTAAPAMPVFQSSCISNSSATMNCQLSGVPSGAKITIQLIDNGNSTALTAARICPGTISCGSSTDVLNPDVGITHTANDTVAAWSDCQASGTLTGSVMVTIVVSGFSGPHVFAEVWTGGATTNCFDQKGVVDTSGLNASISTDANVTAANEVAVSVIASGTAINAGSTGLCAGAACTMQNFSGGQGMETSTTSPTNGTAATMSWARASGVWAGMVDTYK